MRILAATALVRAPAVQDRHVRREVGRLGLRLRVLVDRVRRGLRLLVRLLLAAGPAVLLRVAGTVGAVLAAATAAAVSGGGLRLRGGRVLRVALIGRVRVFGLGRRRRPAVLVNGAPLPRATFGERLTEIA